MKSLFFCFYLLLSSSAFASNNEEKQQNQHTPTRTTGEFLALCREKIGKKGVTFEPMPDISFSFYLDNNGDMRETIISKQSQEAQRSKMDQITRSMEELQVIRRWAQQTPRQSASPIRPVRPPLPSTVALARSRTPLPPPSLPFNLPGNAYERNGLVIFLPASSGGGSQ